VLEYEKYYAKAHLDIISKRQIIILRYIAQRGTTILERTYKDLSIPKPTCQHHLAQLKKLGLIETLASRGRTKPVKLTELGQAVVKLFEGKTISDKERIKISAFDVALALGLTLNKDELRKLVEIYTEVIEKGKKPPNEKFNKMIV
jgi:DNA-binding MarR family transcriptional regulator